MAGTQWRSAIKPLGDKNSYDVPSTRSKMRTSTAIIEAVADGDLTPAEASEMSRVIDSFTRALEAIDFEERISKLEGIKR